MRNILLCALSAVLFSSCHPSYVYLKKNHAKHIKGTQQVMIIQDYSEFLRFDRSQIHISSEKNGKTFFIANPGANGRGVITRPHRGKFQKYKYKINKNPSRK